MKSGIFLLRFFLLVLFITYISALQNCGAERSNLRIKIDRSLLSFCSSFCLAEERYIFKKRERKLKKNVLKFLNVTSVSDSAAPFIGDKIIAAFTYYFLARIA